jgi:hypothetical protein
MTVVPGDDDREQRHSSRPVDVITSAANPAVLIVIMLLALGCYPGDLALPG